MTKLEVINRIQARLNELGGYILKEALGHAQWRDNEDAQRASRDVTELLTKLDERDY